MITGVFSSPAWIINPGYSSRRMTSDSSATCATRRGIFGAGCSLLVIFPVLSDSEQGYNFVADVGTGHQHSSTLSLMMVETRRKRLLEH